MQKRRKDATVQDVAKMAGVSVATVSRAINGSIGVRKSTLAKVNDAVNSLGYMLPPKQEAVESASKQIVVVIPDLGNPFYAEIIKGALLTANRCGYEVLTWQCEQRDYTVEEILEHYHSFNAIGAILAIPTTPAIIQAVDAIIPIVQCCEYSAESLPYVTIDNYQASRSAIKFLISKGRKKIAFINGSPVYKYAQERQRGYIDVMHEAGLEIKNKWIVNMNESSYEPVISVVSQMLLSEDRPDAIFAVSDTFGAAVIKAAKRNGLNLPQDLYVIGFDNTTIGRLCDPSLTTVNQPQLQLGSLACEMLLERIHNPGIPNNFTMLETELIIRESTP